MPKDIIVDSKVETFSNENMLKYYEEFDPIDYKYKEYEQFFLDNKNDKQNTKRINDIRKRLAEHEHSKNFAELTKKDMDYMFSNLKKIYGDEEQAKYVVTNYHLIYTRVIGLYINIDGIERLFSDLYANFEWELHMGMDYDNHKMNYYRDHFIHQVKDAYMLDKLLTEHNYIETVRNILKERNNSKISAYVMKHIVIQREEGSLFENILIEHKDIVTNYMQQNCNNKSFDELIDEYYLDNIIKMSAYMSGLFHDIGYPIVANMMGNQSITNYIFETYNLNDVVINFNKIKALLGNSLLFRVEPLKKIKKRLEGNEEAEQKIDHGAVSAIVFLLHFYENGAIHRLEPYKACAVELAGLAIYNHTNRYTYIDGVDRDYYRNVFYQNPISYLLRECDDLQEWGRIYFELSDQSNIIICEKCKTPIIKVKVDDNGFAKYVCHCDNTENGSGYIFTRAFTDKGFPYRRIYKVSVCDNVVFNWDTIRLENDEEKKVEYINIKYDFNRLLHIAYISPSYAKYRANELKQIKKMLLRQDVPYTTYINSFMSANIIAIKAEIIGEQFLKRRMDGMSKGLNNKFDVTKNSRKKIKTGFKYLFDKYTNIEKNKDYSFIDNKIKKIQNENIRQYLYNALKFYIELYVIAYVISFYNLYSNINNRDKFIAVCKEYIAEFKRDKGIASNSELSILIDDYFRYSEHRFFHIENYPYIPDMYLDEFISNDELYVAVKSFCNTDNDYPNLPRNGVDAYSDLYLFKIIEEINNKKPEINRKRMRKKT